MLRSILRPAVLLLVVAAPLRAPLSAQDFIVSPTWLAARLADPTVVVLHVGHDGYAEGHVPGAREVTYADFVTRRGALSTELPDAPALRSYFEGLGVSDNSTVVVYAREAPTATRALLALAHLGITRISYLDGGLARWREEGHPLSRETPVVVPGRITRPVDETLVVSAEFVTARLEGASFAFVDSRTEDAYRGAASSSAGLQSAGHLAGARLLEWEDLFSDRSTRLKPRAEMERLFRAVAAPGDTVVTYCWVGYRASVNWFVARALGHTALLYDGSYQDWSQRALPTRAGTTP